MLYRSFFSAIVMLLFSAGISPAQNDTCLTTLTPGISFPPVADATQRDFTRDKLDDLGVKKIRFAEDWALREPEEGNYHWQALDDRLTWAYDHGYEVMLTIQSHGPDWACDSTLQSDVSCVFKDTSLFRIYIDTLLKRYGNRISKIQFGNEWQSDNWYPGSAGDFIATNNVLYDAVRSHAPQVKVVLGGFTTISLRFLAGCQGYVDSFYDGEGHFYDSAYLADNCTSDKFLASHHRIDSVLRYACYDMLDIHLYDDVEQWDEYYACFTDTLTRPVIVSEFGGPNMNYEPYTDEYQAMRLYQYLRKLDSLGIAEAYFFKLVEGTDNPAHSTSALIYDTTYQEKPAYAIFKAFSTCLSAVPQHTAFSAGKISFFPNPMQGETRITLEGLPGHTLKTLILSAVDGRRLRVVRGLTGTSCLLQWHDLPPGIYLVTVTDNEGNRVSGRLAVQ